MSITSKLYRSKEIKKQGIPKQMDVLGVSKYTQPSEPKTPGLLVRQEPVTRLGGPQQETAPVSTRYTIPETTPIPSYTPPTFRGQEIKGTLGLDSKTPEERYYEAQRTKFDETAGLTDSGKVSDRIVQLAESKKREKEAEKRLKEIDTELKSIFTTAKTTPTEAQKARIKELTTERVSVEGTAKPFTVGAIRGITGGLAEPILKTSQVATGVDPTKTFETASKETGYKAGEVAGSLVRQLATYKIVGNLLRATPVGQKLLAAGGAKGIAGQQGLDLAVDTIVQSPGEYLEYVRNNETLGEYAKRFAKNRLIDALFNVGIGYVAGDFKKAKQSLNQPEIQEAMIELDINPEMVKAAIETGDEVAIKNVRTKIQSEIDTNPIMKQYEGVVDQPSVPSTIKEIGTEQTPFGEVPKFTKQIEPEVALPKAEPEKVIGADIEMDVPTFRTTLGPEGEMIKPALEAGEEYRKTIHNSLMRSNMPDEVKEFYNENPSIYKKVSNEETWDAAYNKVNDDFEGSLKNIMEKETLESADDTAESIAIMHKLSQDNNIQALKMVTDDLAEKATKSGQAIQAMVILQKSTPEGKLLDATRIINKANEKLKTDFPSAYKDLENKGKLPELTEDDFKLIKESMEKYQTATGKEKQILLGQVDQLIADKMPITFGDKIKALRNLSLLGNPKTTLIRNPLGNIIFAGLENISQIPSGITDKMLSAILKTKRQTSILPDVKTQLKGFGTGLQDVATDIKYNIDTSPSRGGIELPRSRKIFETAWLNKANNWLGDALKLGDRPFYEAAYEMRLKDLKKLQPDADPTALEKLASEFALQRVFQNEGATAKGVKKFKESLNTFNIRGYGLGDIAMPYTQTPANILAKGVEYTPLNIIQLGRIAAGGTKAGSAGLGKVGKNIALNQKQFTDAVGRMFTGTGILALGYSMAKNGHITGKSQDTSKKVRELKKQAGEQNYSIKFGDKWVSYDWAQPAAIPLAIGVDAYNAGVKEKDFLKQIEKGIISGGDTLFRQSMLRGITNMFGGYSPTEGVVETLVTSPTQFAPTVLGQVAQFKDPLKRDVDYSTGTSQLTGTILRKLPGVREGLPATLDMFGETIPEAGGATGIKKALDVFLNPSRISTETTDPLTIELYRLFKSTSESDVIPSKMPANLTKPQEREFKLEFGPKIKSNLENYMASEEYKGLNDADKAVLVARIISNTYNEVKDKLGYGN